MTILLKKSSKVAELGRNNAFRLKRDLIFSELSKNEVINQVISLRLLYHIFYNFRFGDLYYPENKVDKVLPVSIFTHGDQDQTIIDKHAYDLENLEKKEVRQ